jgi:Flp pilus assembly pilin Flp
MQPRSQRRFWRDQRGTASIEAAMMLPLMGLCWVALFYRLATLDAILVSGVEARRMAWVTSNNACADGGRTYECEGGSSASTTGGGSSGGGDWLDQLTDAPIVGFLFGTLLGSSTTARVSREVDRPVVLGGGTIRAGYGYYIMCNEESMTVQDLLEATICEQVAGVSPFIANLIDCPEERHDAGAIPQGCEL